MYILKPLSKYGLQNFKSERQTRCDEIDLISGNHIVLHVNNLLINSELKSKYTSWFKLQGLLLYGFSILWNIQ